MKRKEIKDLHTKTIDELKKALEDLRNDVGQLKIDKAVGKVKNVNEARQKKKDIARIYTILTEKIKEVNNG